jgi:ribosomal protein S18 acetylase RimI-like enzyme
MCPQFSNLYSSRLDRELGTDDATILFTTARRKSAINEGAQEFADLTECLTRWVTFPIVGGVAEYDLNSTLIIPAGDFNDFAKEPVEFQYTDASSNVTILSGDSLPRRDIRWLDRYREGWRLSTVASSVSQWPELHYVRADGPAFFLGLTPVPSTGSSASALVRLPYIANAPTLVNSTDVPFTFNSSVRTDLATYHQGLVHYAASQLEKLRRDDQASDRQLQKFLGYVSRYLQDLRVKGGRSIMQARSYFKARSGWDFRRLDPHR